MKIRTGFVSNSSSSSFIVVFPHQPKSVDDLKKILFGKATRYVADVWWDDSTNEWPTSQIAKIVWDDIQKQKPNDQQKIVESLCGANDKELAEMPTFDYEYYRDLKSQKEKERYNATFYKKEEAFRNNYTNKLIKDNYTCVIYVFDYEDDCKLGVAMENGSLFNRLKHIKVSHH